MNKIILVALYLCALPVMATTIGNPKNCPLQGEYSQHPNVRSVTYQLQRFYNLSTLMEQAYSSQQHALAEELANEYLDLAEVYSCNWNYGNAVHDGHRMLGLLSLERGEIERAAWFLLDSARTQGSIQLNSFGPNFDLANQLITHGKYKEVLSYLESVEQFWVYDQGMLQSWKHDIKNGRVPEMVKMTDGEYSLINAKQNSRFAKDSSHPNFGFID